MTRARRTTALSAAALALAATAVPLGSTVTSAQSSPIQHVVVLDVENHSFMNVLGFWCQGNPRCGPGDAMPASVTLSDGSVVTPSVSPDVVPDVKHQMNSQLAAMNIVSGVPQMNGWQNEAASSCAASTGYQCVSGYTPSQVPNLTALASAYAIGDRFYSFKDSPSWGGHMYAVAATTDGFTGDNPVCPQGQQCQPGWGADSRKVAHWAAGGPYQPSCVPDFALGLANGGCSAPTKALYVPTIMDRLDAAGLSWRIYGAASSSDGGYDWAVCPTFAECLDTSQRANLVEQSTFFTDAAAGTLPAFSLVVAGGAGNATLASCHNGFSMTACDNFTGQVANAVMTSPDWSSTALVITFDDYGGFYDSAPPPVNPDGTQEGPRLPFILVSPYANPASTDSAPASFASVLAFVEHTFGLAPLEQNDASAYNLSGMLNLTAKPRLGDRPRMVVRPVPKGDRIDWALAKEAS